MGVEGSNFLEEALKNSTSNTIGFLPEQFVGTDYRNRYAYLIRSLTPSGGTKLKRWVPVHGLLSKGELLKKLASRKGISVDQ